MGSFSKGEDTFIGMRFYHKDGTSTFVPSVSYRGSKISPTISLVELMKPFMFEFDYIQYRIEQLRYKFKNQKLLETKEVIHERNRRYSS